MAGCFGNSPIDRYMQRQLDDYLDSLELDCNEDCENCDRPDSDCGLEYLEEKEVEND